MSFVLNAFYFCLLAIGSPWLLWRYVRWGKNRRGWSHKLFGFVPHRDSDRPCIWFHAVSVGEVNLLAPVIQDLNLKRPEVEVVISTTTETGFDLARKKYEDVCVFFFPLDFSWAIKNALKRIKPNLILLTELELWPNFIKLAHNFSISVGDNQSPSRAGTPVAVINGRLSEPSFRGYCRLGRLLTRSFQRLSLVMAQNETYAERFRLLGCVTSRVVVTGNVKFDGLQTDRNNEQSNRLARLAGIADHEFVFLAGSTQFDEDMMAASVYRELATRHAQLRLVVAPRHPERVPELVQALNQMGLPVQRRSQLATGEAKPLPDQNSVILIDVIGELASWWGTADAAYVGGSMGSRGGQNMIEPSAYGIPVAFGPHTENFRDIVALLLEAQAATVVHNQSQLRHFVERTLTDLDWGRQIGKRAQNVVMRHDGASQRTVDLICQLLDQDLPNDQASVAA